MESLKRSLSSICDVNSGVMSLFIKILEKKGYISRPFIGATDAEIYEAVKKANKSTVYYSSSNFVVLENDETKGIVMIEADGVSFRAWNNGSNKICFSVKAGYPDQKNNGLKSLLVRYADKDGAVFDEKSTVRSDSSIDWLSFSKFSPQTIISGMENIRDFEPCEPTYNLSVLPPEIEAIISSRNVPNGQIPATVLIDPAILASYTKYSSCFMPPEAAKRFSGK